MPASFRLMSWHHTEGRTFPFGNHPKTIMAAEYLERMTDEKDVLFVERVPGVVPANVIHQPEIVPFPIRSFARQRTARQGARDRQGAVGMEAEHPRAGLSDPPSSLPRARSAHPRGDRRRARSRVARPLATIWLQKWLQKNPRRRAAG